MRTFSVRVAALIFAAFAPTAVSAALKPFTGPAGWDHTVAATATPALPRSQEAWKKSDGEQLIYLADAGLAFDDMVTQVKKNVADNNMKPSLAKDRTCAGHANVRGGDPGCGATDLRARDRAADRRVDHPPDHCRPGTRRDQADVSAAAGFCAVAGRCVRARSLLRLIGRYQHGGTC